MTETHEPGEGVEGQGLREDQPVGIEPAVVDVDAEVAMMRELVYKAHPDVVRELLVGQTLPDILASIEPARAAYQRIVERVEQNLQREREASTPSSVGAGVPPVQIPVVVPDRSTLTTTQRLRLGLRERAGTPQ